MSPITGRPKSLAPKNNDVKVRLDDATHQKLLQYCEAHGLTKAEAIRKGIENLLAEKE